MIRAEKSTRWSDKAPDFLKKLLVLLIQFFQQFMLSPYQQWTGANWRDGLQSHLGTTLSRENRFANVG